MTGYFGVSEVSPFNGHSEGTFKAHWHLRVLMLDPSRQVEASGDSPVSQMRCVRETPTETQGPVEEGNHGYETVGMVSPAIDHGYGQWPIQFDLPMKHGDFP